MIPPFAPGPAEVLTRGRERKRAADPPIVLAGGHRQASRPEPRRLTGRPRPSRNGPQARARRPDRSGPGAPNPPTAESPPAGSPICRASRCNGRAFDGLIHRSRSPLQRAGLPPPPGAGASPAPSEAGPAGFTSPGRPGPIAPLASSSQPHLQEERPSPTAASPPRPAAPRAPATSGAGPAAHGLPVICPSSSPGLLGDAGPLLITAVSVPVWDRGRAPAYISG